MCYTMGWELYEAKLSSSCAPSKSLYYQTWWFLGSNDQTRIGFERQLAGFSDALD